MQSIAYMNPDIDYYHRTFFSPDTCGTHTIYAKAWSAGSPEVQASTATNATLGSVDFAQALIASTTRANITNAELSNNLIALLNTTLQDFQQGQTDAGNTALSAYMQQLAAASGKGITAGSAGVLTGQAGVVLGCGSSGFLVSASPSSATVSTGSAASYALAITPAGGFSGEVSLACIGAPQGIHCSFSSPSVTLDGFGQAHVTVTVSTGSSVTDAGMMLVMPSAGSARLKFLLMLLLTAFAAAFLQRARMRQTIFGCLVALMPWVA